MFIPLVLTLWGMLFGMAYYQYYNEREYRKNEIKEQLSLINARVIAAAMTETDPVPFLDFVADYYIKKPLYDRIRITVYENGAMLKTYGEPIGLNEEEIRRQQGLTTTPGINEQEDDSHKEYFYYKRDQSPDGRYVIYTVLPFDNDVITATMPSDKIFWVMISIAIVMTIISFYSTRYFGRNIRILRTIANQAASDPNFIPPMNYPHDELGDITRQIVHMYNKRLESLELQKREHEVALHAIEDKARAKRQLTNNINHELRTPIGVIKGYLDTIMDTPDMDEGARNHFIRKAQEHVNRLVNLIADVSAITRLEEGGELINTEELDYHDLVFTMASDLETSGAIGSMTFSYDLPFGCEINGNYNLLTGMLLNLAKNAASYSKGTRCELKYLGEDDKFYKFVFQDNGVGVGEEHLPHLFERFYRIDSGRARKAGGTGLGLPIVEATITAHGGEISVANGELGGLAFTFTLPKYKRR